MFAQAIIRLRWLIVSGWIVAAVASTLLLPPLSDTQSNSVGDLVATDADAVQAEIRSVEEFEFPLLSRTIVVERNPEGLSPAALRNFSRRATQLIRGELPGLEGVAFALPATNVLGEPPFSRESSTTALTYLFFPPEIGPVGRTGLANRYIDRYLEPGPGTYVGVTGTASARAEQRQLIASGLSRVEIATVILIVVAVALHFRALAAPLINLLAVAISYLVGSRVLGAAGSALGVGIPPEVEPVMVALLFGVVTDYSIFFLSRFRALLEQGEHEDSAVRTTTSDLLPIVTVAGLTVAAATGTLVLAELGFFRAFGPGLSLSILVSLAVVTTLIPALLSIIGSRVFWPGVRGRAVESSPRSPAARLRDARRRLLRFPITHPVTTVIATVIPLLALGTLVLQLEVGNRTIGGLPADSEPRVAYAEAGEGFAPGILSPTVVLIEGERISAKRGEIVRLQKAIAGRPHIAQVLGPQQTGQAALPVDFGAVFSEGGRAARLFVVLDQNPLGSRGIATVRELKEELPQLLSQVGLADAEASLAGDTALSAETVEKSGGDLARVVPAASFVVLAILVVFLGALVAPLYLVLASLLALAASLGLAVLFFQGLLGYADLAFYVPFAATVLLVALGSDYNVYLVGRVWSEARRSGSLRAAVEVAGARATSAITVAGLVLAASFATLALVPLRPFQEIAFTVAVGLLIDAFIVRSLLVPALITLFGERSAWPGGFKRLPKPPTASAGLDGAAPDRPS